MSYYHWSFSALKVSESEGNLQNVIVSVNYCLTLVEGGASTYCRGEVSFSSPDPGNFIEFLSISESDMISFVESALGESLEQIKKGLKDRLRTQGTIEKELPWLSLAPTHSLPNLPMNLSFNTPSN